MNTKYLFQALKFACLPTLSVLTLLFFGFFDIQKTISFIASDNGWAITLRIILAIAEIALVIIMYYHYQAKGIINDAKKGIIDNDKCSVDYDILLYRLKKNWDRQDDYFIHNSECDNIVVIERVVKFKSN